MAVDLVVELGEACAGGGDGQESCDGGVQAYPFIVEVVESVEHDGASLKWGGMGPWIVDGTDVWEGDEVVGSSFGLRASYRKFPGV